MMSKPRSHPPKSRPRSPLPGPRPPRHPELGAVVVLVSFLWTTLFALAALAIDIGYLYQSQRGLQAAADAAVMAGLPQLSTNQTTATNNATAMATANGYTNGAGGVNVNVNTTTSATISTLTVQIIAPQPTFFAGIFGMHSKSLMVSATGQTSSSAPGIYAIDADCSGSDLGLKLNGGATIVKGGIESAGELGFYTGPGATVDGPVTSACPGPLHVIGGMDTFNGGPPAASTPPASGDPFGYTIATDFPVSKCSFGTDFSPTPVNVNSIPGIWNTGGPAAGTLNNAIICSGSDIQLNGGPITGTITLVAYGTIEVSGVGITLTAAPGGDNMVAFSESNSGSTNNCTSPANAIQMGNTDWTLNGSLYAPNGCISAGGTNFNVNGSIIGYEVNTAFSGTIDPGGGGGGSTYYLYQ